jgi:hypothetical protein
MPPTRTVTMATSTAQNDAGVFELSFRDERYMPFEGLGAISQWQLTLPKAFRQFDYQTINDVIVSISYTAEQDGALRQAVEQQNAQMEGAILAYYTQANPSAPRPKRLFSLRQDFSSVFTRLMRSPAGTVVTLELGDRNFPFFLRGRSLSTTTAVLILQTAPNASPAGFQMTIDGGAALTFRPDSSSPPLYDGLLQASLGAGFVVTAPNGGKATHTLTISAPGGLAPKPPPPGDVSAVDADLLRDIFLYVEYTLAP